MEKKTSKAARVAAILGSIALAALYVIALVFALIEHPLSTPIIMSAIFCSFAIPFMIFAFIRITKLLSGKEDETVN